MVKDDLPLPDTPVTTISLLRGKLTVTFLRLCTRAPFTMMLPESSVVFSIFGDFVFVAIGLAI